MVISTPLLDGQELSKTFPIEGGVFRRRIGSVHALKKVSFQIAKGETLAVVGGSGCGKSTLAKLIVGLLSPDSGDILWKGESIARLPAGRQARHIQMIFQDPFASLNPKLSIGTQLREVVGLAKGGPSHTAGQDEIAGRLLESVGLERDSLRHYPFQFSGGQRQRIAIARALALQPELLIADEPLSSLDVTVQSHVLKLLKELKKTYALTILLISHDLAVVDSFADRMIVLQNGEKVEEGVVTEVLAKPGHPYTQALLDAVPRIPVHQTSGGRARPESGGPA